MARLKIVQYPDPLLKERSNEVTRFDAKLHTLLDNMIETMYVADGIGLAGPQVGELHRITVIDVSEERNQPIDVINPVVVQALGKSPSEEGCLSIPGYRDTIHRAAEVVVQACDRHGKPFEIRADGLLARCLQHEIDHLNGVLFIDHLSRLKRQLFRHWWKKQQLEERPE